MQKLFDFFGFAQDQTAREINETWGRRLIFCLLLVAVGFIVPTVALGQQAIQGILLPSAARTATAASPDINNPGNRGIHVIVNISAFTSGTFTAKVQGKNPITGAYYDILSSAALNGTGVTVLKVYPGITPTNNLAASDVIPKTWRLEVVGASTPIGTYSVGYFSIP